MNYTEIATYIFSQAIQETYDYIGHVDIEQVEKYFDIKITYKDFVEISDTIWEFFSKCLLDVNNNDNEYYFEEEKQFSLNFYGDMCFGEVNGNQCD